MRVTDGTVCDKDTLKPFLKTARWLMANSTSKIESKEPSAPCFIGTIIKIISSAKL
jgi:hypothetical protein